MRPDWVPRFLGSHGGGGNVLGRHAFAIPYYNLDVLLGRPVSIDPAAVEEKGVNTRRGGDGFEQSTLMKVLIGIKVAPLIADTLADTLEGSDPHQPFRGNLRIGPNLACPGLDGNV